MKSHNKIIVFLSVCTLATNFQTVYGMHALKMFSKNSATLATGMLSSYFAYDLYARKEAIEKDQTRILQKARNNPQPKTEAFVLETLHAAYPELKGRTIEVIAGSRSENKSFSVTAYKGINRIYIPFDDKDLELARDCKSNHLRAPEEKIAEFIKANNIHLSIDEYIATQEHIGIAMIPSNLDSWHWSILHEGSHITYNDVHKRENVAYALTPLVLLACAKSMQKFSAPLLLAAGVTTLATPHAMKCHCEYRADQETIKRSKDAALFKAASESFANYPKRDVSTLSNRIQYYLDPHPSNQRRAVYLNNAAKKLEEKLAKD